MKGTVFISHSLFLVRFVACGAFDELEKRHNITYVVLDSPEEGYRRDVAKHLDAEHQKILWIPHYPIRFLKWQELFDLSCIRYVDRSPSFAIRYEGFSRRNPEKYARYEDIARPGIYKEYRAALEADMGPHPDILQLAQRERPDFFVPPSGVFDYLTDDVLYVADQLSVPTVMLVAGWDNISSKGFLYRHPTVLGVWGEQSKQHAVDVQDSDPERADVIGAPHYEKYRPLKETDKRSLRAALGVPDESPLVLLGGGVREFDETQLLLDIEEGIENGTLPPMHIVYRPHPYRWARDEDDFFKYAWQHVTMDPSMIESYQAHKEGRRYSTVYQVDYLEKLYRACACLVSPMSTVLLEAMLFGMPVLAIAFSDGKHHWSADKGAQMVHFKEMYDVPGIIICRDKENFFSDFGELVSRVGDDELSAAISKGAQFFVSQGENSYSERLAALVERMLLESEPPEYDTVDLKPGRRYWFQQLLRYDLPGILKKVYRRARNLALSLRRRVVR